MQKLTCFILILIVLLAVFLRFYKLDSIPASLNWDEIAAGYNAYTVANWGMDEYGSKFPLVFTSFADDKHPVHIYLTAIVVKMFGLSDFNIRATSAGIGVLTVIFIFFLAKELFDSNLAGLFSSLFLAVSPYHIHFSRGLWENNFALFFLTAGVVMFYIGLRKYEYLIPIGFTFFGLSFFSYHSAKVVVPIVVLLICIINFRHLIKTKIGLTISVLVVLLFGILIIKDTRILGFARMGQTKFSDEQIKTAGGKFNLVFANYKKHFTYEYLFNSGDQSPRASVKVIGQFYKLDLALSLFGLFVLIYKKKWQSLSLILTWLLISPIPSSISSIEPSAIRGIFTIVPVLLLSASGTEALIVLFKNNLLKILIALVLIILLGREVINYLNYYSKVYPVKEAIEWQYGMKEIVEYSEKNPTIHKMYVDNIRQQPYIYFLYYLRTPLSELLNTVRYDKSNAKSFNTVLSFDKYQFGSWNIIDSNPNEGIVYAVTPSYYTGLRFTQQFDVVKQIKYPDRSDAFFIVTGHAQ
ncbi:MAG: Glycosyl transferase family 39 [uncultured bacterium]|nr:MAG: Glycosyl transferase family 39 [uncultured bacterium]